MLAPHTANTRCPILLFVALLVLSLSVNRVSAGPDTSNYKYFCLQNTANKKMLTVKVVSETVNGTEYRVQFDATAPTDCSCPLAHMFWGPGGLDEPGSLQHVMTKQYIMGISSSKAPPLFNTSNEDAFCGWTRLNATKCLANSVWSSTFGLRWQLYEDPESDFSAAVMRRSFCTPLDIIGETSIRPAAAPSRSTSNVQPPVGLRCLTTNGFVMKVNSTEDVKPVEFILPAATGTCISANQFEILAPGDDWYNGTLIRHPGTGLYLTARPYLSARRIFLVSWEECHKWEPNYPLGRNLANLGECRWIPVPTGNGSDPDFVALQNVKYGGFLSPDVTDSSSPFPGLSWGRAAKFDALLAGEAVPSTPMPPPTPAPPQRQNSPQSSEGSSNFGLILGLSLGLTAGAIAIGAGLYACFIGAKGNKDELRKANAAQPHSTMMDEREMGRPSDGGALQLPYSTASTAVNVPVHPQHHHQQQPTLY